MPPIDFRHSWLAPGEDEDLFGPEKPTFAELVIELDGQCLTSNISDTLERKGVAGPLSGIADWIVENWLPLFWETHTPFCKVVGDHRRVPTLRDVRSGERLDVDYAQFAGWYHRHTLGHATSDVALPSITFLPEDTVVGVAVRAPPSTFFVARFATEPLWIPKDDLAAALTKLVVNVATRAGGETPGWAAWLLKKFEEKKAEAQNPEVRRELQFGPMSSAS